MRDPDQLFPYPQLLADGSLQCALFGTTNIEEQASLIEKSWAKMSQDSINKKFWADEIKKHAEEPIKRLNKAMENLPLPGAYQQAAIALRKIIKENRKLKTSFDTEFELLYWLAAMQSFHVPYAEKLEEPGHNVIESIPGSEYTKMKFTYNTLGFENLSLLNKTDKNLIVNLWGIPNAHTTLNKMHRHLWDKYESKLLNDKRESMAKFARLIRRE